MHIDNIKAMLNALIEEDIITPNSYIYCIKDNCVFLSNHEVWHYTINGFDLIGRWSFEHANIRMELYDK